MERNGVVGPDRGPVAPFDGGLSRQTMENATLRARKGFVADEVVEASPEARGDDLK